MSEVPKLSAVESSTPALDELQGALEGDAVSPEVYFKAAVEAYAMLGNALSDVGSLYLLLGSMMGAIEVDEGSTDAPE